MTEFFALRNRLTMRLLGSNQFVCLILFAINKKNYLVNTKFLSRSVPIHQ